MMGCGSPVVKVSNIGRQVMSSSPVPLKTRIVGQRCTLNLSRAEMSSRWCGVVVRRGVPAQVSSSSLDHGSKLQGPSPKDLVYLNSATLIFTHSLGIMMFFRSGPQLHLGWPTPELAEYLKMLMDASTIKYIFLVVH
ncbi:uncharacterized protein TNCV_3672051 [Trichonephila clavipes]|nr:uncharacterized protein TNCV_3672051 [Trichonephila clavipes]